VGVNSSDCFLLMLFLNPSNIRPFSIHNID
jgi:hypothetical protein